MTQLLPVAQYWPETVPSRPLLPIFTPTLPVNDPWLKSGTVTWVSQVFTFWQEAGTLHVLAMLHVVGTEQLLVREGKFREDLFYRLNVVALWVPPLRTRPADIESLALHFCTSVAVANGRRAPAFDADALSLLAGEPWPGNVRQLQNVVERLVVLTPGPRIAASDVTRELRQKPGALAFAEASGFAPKVDLEQTALELEQALAKAERRALQRAMTSAGGNKNLAARLLGISRRSLYRKLEQYGL